MIKIVARNISYYVIELARYDMTLCVCKNKDVRGTPQVLEHTHHHLISVQK